MIIPKSFLFSIFVLSSICSFSQIFSWANDGYNTGSGGGTYSNIDNSGIDITVSGLINDNSFNTSVKTGINDQAANGFIHNYGFSFSEPVDVEFIISNINENLISECFNDLIVFSNSPVLTYYGGGAVITGDSVVPTTETGGSVLVRYNSITSFSFSQGNGVSCNPGYIILSEFTINDNLLNTGELSSVPFNFIHNDAMDEIKIDCKTCTEIDFEIFDAMGKKYNPPFNFNSGEFIIPTENFPQGLYFIRLLIDKEAFYQKRVLLN